MEHFTLLAIGPSSEDIERTAKLVLAVGATAFSLLAMFPLVAKSDDLLKWMGKKMANAGSKIKNATSKTAGGFKEEAQGKFARDYDPSKSGWKGRNLAIRAATGNLSPGDRSRRRIIAAGRSHEDAAVKDAEHLLRASKLDGNPKALAALAWDCPSRRWLAAGQPTKRA